MATNTCHGKYLPILDTCLLPLRYIADYGWKLLLIICGDIEVNPGPSQSPLSQYISEAKNNPETQTQHRSQSTEDIEKSQQTDIIQSQIDTLSQSQIPIHPTPVPPVRKKKKRGRPAKSPTSQSIDEYNTSDELSIEPRYICPQCTVEVTYDDKGLECEGCFFGFT